MGIWLWIKDLFVPDLVCPQFPSVLVLKLTQKFGGSPAPKRFVGIGFGYHNRLLQEWSAETWFGTFLCCFLLEGPFEGGTLTYQTDTCCLIMVRADVTHVRFEHSTFQRTQSHGATFGKAQHVIVWSGEAWDDEAVGESFAGLGSCRFTQQQTYHLGMVNTSHDDLGMVYYWVHHIIFDDIKLYTYHILVGE